MKKIPAVLVSIAAFLLFLVVFGIVFRNPLLKAGLELTVTQLTGFPTHVKKLQLDFPSTLKIEDLKIGNPPGFQEKLFAHFPEIFIALDLDALLHKRRVHLTELRLNLQDVYIENNEKGVSNVSLLKSAGSAKKTAKGPEPETPAKSGQAAVFYLDRMELTVRRVHFQDHSKLLPAGSLGEKKFSVDLNIDKQVFVNIEKPQAIVQLILLKVLYGKAMGSLKSVGVDPNELVDTLNFQKTLKSVKASGEEVLQQTTGLLTQKTGSAIKGAGEQLTGLLGKFQKPKIEGQKVSSGT